MGTCCCTLNPKKNKKSHELDNFKKFETVQTSNKIPESNQKNVEEKHVPEVKIEKVKTNFSQKDKTEFFDLKERKPTLYYSDLFNENNIIRVSFENGMPKLNRILSKNEDIIQRNESLRKTQYIICEDNLENNDTIFLKEKEVYDIRSNFLDQKCIIEYFKQINTESDFSKVNKIETIRSVIEHYSDLLMKSYGIQIIALDENINLDYVDYSVNCAKLNQEENFYERFMPLILYEIMLYPVSLIFNTNLNKIYICDSFITSESQDNTKINSLSNVSRNEISLIYSTDESNIENFKENFHSEIFKLIMKQFFFNDSDFNWELLNPEGFSYDDEKNKELAIPIPGFINSKCIISLEEDKAQTFAFMMSHTNETFEIVDPILRDKIVYIVKLLEEYDPRGIGGDNYFIILKEIRNNLKVI